MKALRMMIMAGAALALSAGVSLAACPDQNTAAMGDKTNAIAKDGTHAPLETTSPASSGDQASAGGNAIKKDGQTMPLASGEGGGDKNLATSQQDVNAQQKGDKTAAAQAEPRRETCAD